jgi:hypothetical protein
VKPVGLKSALIGRYKVANFSVIDGSGNAKGVAEQQKIGDHDT